MKENLRRIVLIALGAVFIASALLKLYSIRHFELYLFGFGLLSFDLCTLAARLLIAGELMLGAGLAAEYRPKITCRIGFAATLLFSLWLMRLAAAGRTDNCRCFGEAFDLDPLQSLAKNAVLLAGFVWAGRSRSGRTFGRYVPLAVAALLTAGVFCISPRPAFIRTRRAAAVPQPCADFLAERLPEGHRLAVFYGADCSFCGMAAAKVDAILRRHDIPPGRVHAVFMQTQRRMDEFVARFFARAGAAPHPWSEVGVLTFIELTNGTFPLLVLTDKGRIVEAYDYNSLDEQRVWRFLR